jgi:hypothetical protein
MGRVGGVLFENVRSCLRVFAFCGAEFILGTGGGQASRARYYYKRTTSLRSLRKEQGTTSEGARLKEPELLLPRRSNVLFRRAVTVVTSSNGIDHGNRLFFFS